MPVITRDLPTPDRALVIPAHPDDAEFGAGATIAKWSSAGCEVSWLVCTDGSKGSWDPDEDRARLVATRRDEQRAAAAALGATGRVVFLEAVDGELEAGMQRRWEVAYWIRRLRPDVVLSHDPWRRWRLHPDHHHAGRLAVEGIVAARDPHFFPEQQVAPHRPRTLLLWEAEDPDHAEDVTGFVDRKLAALECHRSQLRSTMGVGPDDDGTALEAFRHRIRERLAAGGRAVMRPAAELFVRIDRL